MLHGVYFRTTGVSLNLEPLATLTTHAESGVQPEYVNRFVLTDAYVASQKCAFQSYTSIK